MHLRAADADDGPALTAALLEAVNWDGRPRSTREQVLAEPHLAHYVTGWPRPGDVGVVADSADTARSGSAAGATERSA